VSKRLNAVIASLVGAAALISGVAQAEVERLPASGAPAFQLDVPAGWTTRRSGDNLFVTAGDRSAILVLSMIAGADANTVTLDAAAAAALTGNATPFSRSEPTTFAGMAATAYYSTTTIPSVGVAPLRMVLARVDATHIAMQTEVVLPGATPAQRQALGALAAGVTVVSQ
jgi:hypothetical protein